VAKNDKDKITPSTPMSPDIQYGAPPSGRPPSFADGGVSPQMPSRASGISRAPPPAPRLPGGHSHPAPPLTSLPVEPTPSIAELVGNEGRTVRESINQAKRISNERDSLKDGIAPTSSSSNDDHSVSDHAVLGFCEILALMFGLPPGEALFRGEPLSLRLVGFIVVGAIFAALGPGWPAVRKKFPQQALVLSIGRIASDARYWLAVILIGFLYAASPEMYRRAVVPVASTSPASIALCTDGPCAPVHLKSGPQYFKEIGLGVGPEPLSLLAIPAVTADRLRIVVDYSEYRSGWMPKTRAFIGEIKEPVKGKTERLQLIYSAVRPNGGTNNLWWGDPAQDHAVSASTFNGSPLPAIIVRARVAIIGPGGEQHYYFILIRDAENRGTQVGIIPEHDSGDWIESWEAD
jgi:hypothetical protein